VTRMRVWSHGISVQFNKVKSWRYIVKTLLFSPQLLIFNIIKYILIKKHSIYIKQNIFELTFNKLTDYFGE